MPKSNLKQISYDVIIITSQNFSVMGHSNQNFWQRKWCIFYFLDLKLVYILSF